MSDVKFALILSLALLSSSFASAKPHRHRDGDKDEEAPKETKKKYVLLSRVQDQGWIGRDMGMSVYTEPSFGNPYTNFTLHRVFTNNPNHLTPSGAIRFVGITLSSDTLISLEFKTRWDSTFLEATLRFQLENLDDTSSIKNIHLDTFHKLCNKKEGHKTTCVRIADNVAEKNDVGLLVLDGIPLPTFDDFEFENGVGTMRVWLEDDLHNILMEGRMFVTNDE
ncbi:hypothetical protein PMAYCL1PPCAC_26531 [Pristionchus mayeri]|uniref:Uncharacterized protein n=1 Tax=Pristionchus mayeri TaxID=1317129 RepID=A0AAN5D4Q0_9BILA|nr:hypothetical protein PMAYCL1PPCAC_26531 [Pristionchus mayeri]